ncbi:hypothetical protein FRX31_020950 [Thalictrum thalictroides]|uniref:DUF4283 domain-containing protein n=1 Tax=Thalictrum thalictroides TaxID=46969 RepID=A0A7J6VXB1_THATH|nr:hypothetical protein FRX31_020950 [Thalictrum thalictroides]
MVKSVVLKRWNLDGEVEIALDGDMFYFTFNNEQDRVNVIDEGSFFIAGKLFVIRTWSLEVEGNKGVITKKLGAVEPQARGIVEAQAQKGSEMENNLKLRASAGNLGTHKFNVTSNKFSCLEALEQEDEARDDENEQREVELGTNSTQQVQVIEHNSRSVAVIKTNGRPSSEKKEEKSSSEEEENSSSEEEEEELDREEEEEKSSSEEEEGELDREEEEDEEDIEDEEEDFDSEKEEEGELENEEKDFDSEKEEKEVENKEEEQILEIPSIED